MSEAIKRDKLSQNMEMAALVKLFSRNFGKAAALRFYLALLKYVGRGAETMMICSPNDPIEEIDKEVTIIVDDFLGCIHPETYKYKETRHIHPVKTVEEWCSELGVN